MREGFRERGLFVAAFESGVQWAERSVGLGCTVGEERACAGLAGWRYVRLPLGFRLKISRSFPAGATLQWSLPLCPLHRLCGHPVYAHEDRFLSLGLLGSFLTPCLIPARRPTFASSRARREGSIHRSMSRTYRREIRTRDAGQGYYDGAVWQEHAHAGGIRFLRSSSTELLEFLGGN